MDDPSSRVRLNTIRFRVPDAADGQVWIQSTTDTTHKLNRGQRDDFSFAKNDLIFISNRGEDFCTLWLEAFACGESGLCVGSNRRGSVYLREKETRKIRMKPGEVLSARSIDAAEPIGRHGDGSEIRLRHGQAIATP